MKRSLLTTKFHVPPLRPPERLVPRPRLIERLNAGLQAGHALTLVAAPAGFGKTTLLREWSRWIELEAGEMAQSTKVAWLSLDEDDNDPTSFWAYVMAALQTIDGEIARDVTALLQSPQPPPTRIILTNLVNELAASARQIILVLDDYHTISNQAIHDGVAFLLEHQPESLHLVLSTRADPPLPIFRLRARGQLTELRGDALRFTIAEATAFVNQMMELGLPSEDVAALTARTEGWIVGLQLAALSMQGRADRHALVAAFGGGHYFVLDYLTGEVLDRQPEPIRRFLLQTSILDRMCGSLCDALGGESGGDAMLAHLERRNLFIVPLDDERRWYRYHHLFADLLGNFRRKELPLEQIFALHRKASRWHEQNSAPEDAIKHALRAQDFERAAILIERTISVTISRGSVTTLLQWSSALPKEIVLARPRLRMYQGWAMFLNAQLPLAKPMFQEAKEALRAMAPSPDKDRLRGELAAMLATLSVVDQAIPQAIQEAQEALTYLPEDDPVSRARATRALGVAYGSLGQMGKAIQKCGEAKALALAAGNRFLAAEIISQLAAARVHQGCLRQAARCYREIIDLTEPSRFPPAGLGYIGLADVCLEWNDLDAVQDYLDRGMALCRRGGIGYGLRPAYCTRAILRQALDDTEGALEDIYKAAQFEPTVVLLEGAVSVASYQVRLRLLLGDVRTAYRWARGDGVIPNVSFENLPVPLYERQQVALARVHLARGEPDKVLAIYDRVCAPAQAAGRMARVVEISLLKALALQARSQPDAALAPFQQCLSLAERGGYVRLFLEAGAPVVALLSRVLDAERRGPRAVSDGAPADYAGLLLEVFAPDPPAPSIPDAPALIEPLTERECEVLRLLVRGLSNREIAQALFIAVGTVKTHVHNIYGKLDVRDRPQAIVRAGELGLD